MTELSAAQKIKLMVNFFCSNDKNRDGKIQESEAKDAKKYDKDGDGTLSPWEFMESANAMMKRQIYSQDEIDAMRELNQKGKTFDTIDESGEIDLCGITFDGSKKISFHENGVISHGTLVNGTEIKFRGKKLVLRNRTEVSFSKTGELRDFVLDERGTVNNISFSGSTRIILRDTGGLLFVGLGMNTAINGVTYKRMGSFADLDFHDNGKVHDGTLAENSKILIGDRKVSFMQDTRIRYHENGIVEEGFLLENTPLLTGSGRRVVFKAGTDVNLFASGRVNSGILGESLTIGGVTYPAGSEVSFNEKGRLLFITLSNDITIQGIKFRKADPIAVRHYRKEPMLRTVRWFGENVVFHENGKVSSGAIAGEISIKIQGREELVINQYIYLDKAGRFMSGVLAKNARVQKYLFKKENEVSLYPNRKVKSGTLAEPVEIYGIKFGEESRVNFNNNGRVITVIPANNVRSAEGILYKDGEEIKFFNNGKIDSATLAEKLETKINNIKVIFQAGTNISYFKNARIAGGTLEEDLVFGKIKYKAGNYISFYGDHSGVYIGTLAEPIERDGKIYSAGTEIQLTTSGRVSVHKRGNN